MGTFAKVFCSDVPRTLETAIAMGYAVDDALVVPPGLMEAAMDVVGHHERWSWEYPWQTFATYLRSPGPVENLGTWLRQSWIHVLLSVEDGERVLVISHGRVIEIGVIACLPDIPTDEFVNWGDALRHGEGVRLSFADGRFGNPVLLRTHGQD